MTVVETTTVAPSPKRRRVVVVVAGPTDAMAAASTNLLKPSPSTSVFWSALVRSCWEAASSLNASADTLASVTELPSSSVTVGGVTATEPAATASQLDAPASDVVPSAQSSQYDAPAPEYLRRAFFFSAEYPRPRRRRDSSSLNTRVAGRDVAATRLQGISASRAAASPRVVFTRPRRIERHGHIQKETD